MKLPPRVALPLVSLMILAACDTSPGSGATGSTPSASPATSSPTTPPTTPSAVPASPVAFDKALHDELIAMLERDQADREGTPQTESDQDRTARLKDILRTHGWPTFALVGADGGNAAWAIAQHSDLDPAFQQEALGLLRAAVAARQASPGNLAYLEDRVAAGRGEPQVYGTQIRCGPDGPVPATPIRDEAGVERRRADAGLPTLASYLAEMTTICAQDTN
ncbi:DUF6624 domain-containing protein [Micromonospora sp. WMMD710]|uniref:DUF6624 domain-containing protein n=1 Tax=Micromonospora sp. WMMD710 TaxID=3016085 RepID=UPI0024166698|nr:DUF6624 domain-containing protein [Micromonospora sp. WMMD710]MDG4758448.1 hypothetical protein [Micromonospora sp. WMMD710]